MNQLAAIDSYNLAPHQSDALARLEVLGGNAGVFVQMGGGKTRIALAYCHARRCTRLLVVLPLSVTSVWQREVQKMDFPMDVVDLTEIRSNRDRATRLKNTTAAIVLINYESYWREPLRSAITRWGPDAVILDEVHRIRHRGSRQARFAHTLAQRPSVRVRLGLTGTPITNGLQDAWSIFRALDPALFGRWPEFQSRFLIMGGFQLRQITGERNMEEAHRLIASRSFQWEGSAFAEPTHVPITVKLSARTRKIYDEMSKRAIVEVQGVSGGAGTVVAQIVLTLLLRQQQISCGFVKDVHDHEIDIGDEKATVTVDLVSDAIAQGLKVVVFCRFLHDLALLEERLPGELLVGRISGSVSPIQRKQVQEDFEAGQLDVVLCQIRTAGLGIDLSAAHVAIFYSVGFSLDDFLQAQGRMTGQMRQKHDVVFYHLLAEKTVDEKIYRDLSAKTSIARRATDLSYALDLFGKGS